MSAATPTGARALLYGERYGFAIDATTADTASAAYVGAPYGGTLAIHADNVTDKPNIPLDAAAGLLKGASPLVQSGTSPKMVHFPDAPYVRWTPHNSACETENISGVWSALNNVTAETNVAVAPDGLMTADRLYPTTGSSDHQAWNYTAQDFSGIIATYSVYAKSDGGRWFGLASDNTATSYGAFFDVIDGVVGTVGASALSSSIESVGNGWYRCSVTLATGGAVFRLEPHSADNQSNTWDSAAGAERFFFWGCQLNRGSTVLPYLGNPSGTTARIGIPQAYDAAEAMYGILVEPAATNLLLRSEDFSATWINTQSNDSVNATTAPDGTLTADKIVEDTNVNNQHGVYQAVTTSDDTVYTWSVYAKAAERTWLAVNPEDTSNHHVYFDLANGVVGTVSAGSTASIVPVGNGWYRCIVTRQTDHTTTYMLFVLAEADNDYDYAGDNTSGLYLWGAQAELGSVATSYIPTLGSTGVRAKDAVKATTTTYPYNGTVAESYYVDFRAFDGQYLLMTRYYSSPFDYFQMLLGGGFVNVNINGGGFQVFPTTHAHGTRGQISASAEVNDLAATINGGSLATDTSGSMAANAATAIGFGIEPAFENDSANTFIYRIVIVPRKVANADLPTWRYEA